MNNLIFPIVIEPGDENHAFGVVVPDLPGCHSAGDTLTEAYANAKEAIESHLSVMIDEGMKIPATQSIDEHRRTSLYQGWLWGFVEVQNVPELKKPVRLNISLPQSLVDEIDLAAKAQHLTRSGFLAQAAMKAMHS